MKLLVTNSEMKHKPKTLPEVIRDLVLDFVLYFVTVWQYLLQVILAQGTTQDTLWCHWCLLTVNNTCDLLRIAWRLIKWVTDDMLSLNIFFISLLKSPIQNYQPTPLRKGMGRNWEVCSTRLFKLPQHWEIFIEKGGLNNFVEVTTVLDVCWKHCQLISNVNETTEIEVFLGSSLNFTIRVFNWGLANDHDICKKIDEPEKHYSVQFDQ